MPPRLQELTTYLQRLGYRSAPLPTLHSLRELQRRHTAEFPFETLATLLRMPVPIGLASLERKLLHEGRGGYCFELNRMFLALLQQLGYDARGLTGRVLMGGPEDALPARTHLLVLVTIEGVRYIADVGFGGMVPTAPLRLDSEEEQTTPHESYRVEPRDGQYLLRAQVADEWRAMYVFDLQRQVDIDFEVANWYVSAHPESPFLGQLFVARTGEGLRKTFNNGSFAVHRLGQDSVRRELTDADSVIEVLGAEFGIRVPAHPQLHEAIERLLAKSVAA
ncbi:arylamine N-acetyltransferase family protein [Lysobacter sp. Hz 25]|uniref:arylamine N-acetyltransferase family protein n=1 Tax=Lysobacter sp. Hz 25 TaxID=3383698 RepID=UPI0038D3961B